MTDVRQDGTRGRDGGTPEVGRWNQALYEEYRAAKEGPRKRLLLNQLIVVNEPLVRIMVDQMCGRGESTRRRKGFQAMGGCTGFSALPWDDAMQAGRVALQKALEQFDPSKRVDKHGKPRPYQPGEEYRISGFYKWKLRHEMQRLVYYGEDLVRVPRDKAVERVSVALIGEEQTLDLMSGGTDERLDELEGITAEDIARWDESGEWPESLEEFRAQRDRPAAEEALIEIAPAQAFTNGLDAFLANRAKEAPAGRVETWIAHNAYRLECRRFQLRESDRPRFVDELKERVRVREIFIRAPRRPSVRALAGIRLR